MLNGQQTQQTQEMARRPHRHSLISKRRSVALWHRARLDLVCRGRLYAMPELIRPLVA